MRYLKPEIISSINNIHFIAESQYVVGIIPDPNGCPTVAFSESTGTGVINMEATYVFTINFSSGSPCQGTSSVSAQAAFEDNVLVPDCLSASFDCNFSCQNTAPPTDGEICLTSLSLNGVPQDVTGICLDLPSQQVVELVADAVCPN